MRVSEIRVKRIRVNQGLGVCTFMSEKSEMFGPNVYSAQICFGITKKFGSGV